MLWPKIPGDNFSIREKRDTGQIGHATQKTALFTYTSWSQLAGWLASWTKWSIIGTEIGLGLPPHTGTQKCRTVVGHKMFGGDTGTQDWDRGTPGVEDPAQVTVSPQVVVLDTVQRQWRNLQMVRTAHSRVGSLLLLVNCQALSTSTMASLQGPADTFRFDQGENVFKIHREKNTKYWLLLLVNCQALSTSHHGLPARAC